LGEVLGFNEIMAKIEALETRLANVSAPDRSRSVGQLSDPASQWESKGAPEPSKEASPMSISMENWEAFQNSLSSENRSMASVLREWEFLGSLGDTIEIRRGKSSFSATYLDDPERLDKFLQSCSRFFGRPIQIKIVDGSAFGEENRAEIEKRPELKASELDAIPKPVQDILDVFQGEIKGEVPSRRRIIGKEGSSGMIRREKS
jgi:hypothetical protein